MISNQVQFSNRSFDTSDEKIDMMFDMCRIQIHFVHDIRLTNTQHPHLFDIRSLPQNALSYSVVILVGLSVPTRKQIIPFIHSLRVSE